MINDNMKQEIRNVLNETLNLINGYDNHGVLKIIMKPRP